MIKPDWKESPDWIQWIAQDADGIWHGYDIRPDALANEFGRPDLNQFNQGRFILLERGSPEREWRSTLERRPLAPGEQS